MIHPPKQLESQNHACGNPSDSGFGRNALVRNLTQVFWLPQLIAIIILSVLISIIVVRRLPENPWTSFSWSCLAAFFATFLSVGATQGFYGGAEAWFWNILGTIIFTPIWLIPTALTHLVLRRRKNERE
jgi:hypothetical protein